MRGLACTCAAAALLAACSDAPPRTPRAPGNTTDDSAEARNFPAAVYERSLVWTTLGGDSTIVVPWLFRTESGSDGADRSVQGWLSRGEDWESFFQDRWRTPPTRSPFRIHPRGPMDLIVGEDDALEAILYEEGARSLETVLDEPLSDWRGSGGTTVRVHRGALFLGDRRLEARVLDLTRSTRDPAPEPTDWMYLQAGPELALVLESGPARDAAEPFRGWALLGDEELLWNRVSVRWSDVRSYEEARREIPMSWEIESEDGELTGTLARTASELSTGEGEGPLLPVEGLFRVRGTLTVRGDSIVVRGIVRHIQH